MQKDTPFPKVSKHQKLPHMHADREARLREEFSQQFIHGISERIRGDFGPKQLEGFIRKRFEFFLQAVGKQGLIRLQFPAFEGRLTMDIT